MKIFESTRNQQLTATPSQAILQGLSEDGGLFVLRDFDLQTLDLAASVDDSYQELAQKILSLFLEDFSDEEIHDAVAAAYGDSFDTKMITPLVPVGSSYILELFHGPTSAFKDVGLTLLPQLMSLAVQKQDPGKRVLILTATSGDTGKAALEGFKEVEGVEIMVFYPKGGVSAIQEQQMKTQRGENVSVCAVEGNFDQAQSEIKRLFLEEDFQAELAKRGIQLSSANSINIGRLLPQIVYYFSAYNQLVQSNVIRVGEAVDFIVPTGNFGNILAGYYAQKLGLPVGQLVCASNENHVLHDFISTGMYDKRRQFLQTNSPSMDILISSNLERLLYDLSGQDNPQIAKWMDELGENGFYTLPEEQRRKLQEYFSSGYATQSETQETIKKVYQTYGYLLDPHTAVAYKVWEQMDQQRPAVILATASPYKFSQTVSQALGQSEETRDEFQMMTHLHEKTEVPIPENLRSLQNLPLRHQAESSIDDMKKFIFARLDREG